jgi:hypothetical protein
MKFVAYPGVVDVVGLFQLLDNALADIAERSNVVGKDFNVDTHFSSVLLPIYKYLAGYNNHKYYSDDPCISFISTIPFNSKLSFDL